MANQPKRLPFDAALRRRGELAGAAAAGSSPATKSRSAAAAHPGVARARPAAFRHLLRACHSRTGDGHGMIVERGFPRYPPSYYIDRLREAPDQHFYDVITHGYGAMYSYADRVEPDDRGRSSPISGHCRRAPTPSSPTYRPISGRPAMNRSRAWPRLNLAALAAFVHRRHRLRVGGPIDAAGFFRAWLCTFLFWLGVPLAGVPWCWCTI